MAAEEEETEMMIMMNGVIGSEDEEEEVNGGEHVSEWVDGLPTEELTPLDQKLLSQLLSTAFRVSDDPGKTVTDVHRASQNTMSNLRRSCSSSSSKPFKSLPSVVAGGGGEDPTVLEEDENNNVNVGESFQKYRRSEGSSARPLPLMMEEDPDSRPEEENSAKTLKRPRLVWTPQLHKRFVEVVAHLGIKNAVPKTIMQLMNVEGLGRENVASHLQKYRLYLKRMQGVVTEGGQSSSTDHSFASTPVPQSNQEQKQQQQQQPQAMAMPMPYPMPPMFTMPMPYGQSAMGTIPPNMYPGFEQHHNSYGQDWSGGNNFGSMASYPRVTPGDKQNY